MSPMRLYRRGPSGAYRQDGQVRVDPLLWIYMGMAMEDRDQRLMFDNLHVPIYLLRRSVEEVLDPAEVLLRDQKT